MAEKGQNGETAHKGGWLRRLIDWALFPVSAGVVTNLLVAVVMGFTADHAFSGGWQSALAGAAVVITGLVKLYEDSQK
jgi:putative Ca2+/H+ antiporter (TMEM165/GDT1 family)